MNLEETAKKRRRNLVITAAQIVGWQDAEDIVQESFLRALEYASSDIINYRTYLEVTVRVTGFTWKKWYSGKLARIRKATEGLVLVRILPEIDEAKFDILSGLHHLPDKFQVVILMKDLLGFETKEIASILHISRLAVTGRLHRARSLLKERLVHASNSQIRTRRSREERLCSSPHSLSDRKRKNNRV